MVTGVAPGVLAETNTHKGSRENARMKRRDKVRFERKMTKMFPG